MDFELGFWLLAACLWLTIGRVVRLGKQIKRLERRPRSSYFPPSAGGTLQAHTVNGQLNELGVAVTDCLNCGALIVAAHDRCVRCQNATEPDRPPT